MVISGSGPYLKSELTVSQQPAGSPDPDLFDHTPIQVVAFSPPCGRSRAALHGMVLMQL
jgi:hypothetical protein